MGIRTLSAIAVAAALLSGCATYDLSTPEGVALYQRDLAISEGMVLQAQNSQPVFTAPAPMQIPQTTPYGQPSSTAIVYCNEVSTTVTTCRQVR